MDKNIATELEKWNAADTASRKCYRQLQNLWAARKAASDSLNTMLDFTEPRRSLILNLESTSFKCSRTLVQKPLTIRAVKRGLEKCIDGEENVNAIINVIQAERGKEVRQIITRVNK